MTFIKRFLKNEPLRIILGLLFFIPAFILELLSVEIVPLVLFVVALLVSGITVFIDAVKGILRRDLLDEKFLMSVASIGAMIIGEASEGVAVMLFFLIGEYFEHKATARARNSIKSLVEICPDTARVRTDDGDVEMDAEDVEIGSLIVIRPGERVPIDAIVVEGTAEIDTSALTGESQPRTITVGDTVDSGVVLLSSPVLARTIRMVDESRAARVLMLVEEATENKSREERFITSFSRYYTPIVTVLALLMAVIPSVFGWLTPTDAVYRALSFLVVSCPCALVISVPMAFFGGIGRAASEGVLFKGGNIFSAVATAKKIVFDKTGTLTKGEFRVSEVAFEGIDREELCHLVASTEHNSNHPVAVALKKLSSDITEPSDLREIVGMGVCATVDNKHVAVGNLALMESLSVTVPKVPDGAIYVSVDAKFSGYIIIEDEIKEEASEAIRELSRLGVKESYILSGDKRETAENVAKSIGIFNVESELLPEDKYDRLVSIIEGGSGSTLYVGDGINDAPSIARADVGIAMGERGSDSAIEAADIVIMSDNLSRIPKAISIARMTVRIAKQNIVLAIGIKLAVLALVSINLAGMWLAVFADVGVAVLAILNSMRTLIKKRP